MISNIEISVRDIVGIDSGTKISIYNTLYYSPYLIHHDTYNYSKKTICMWNVETGKKIKEFSTELFIFAINQEKIAYFNDKNTLTIETINGKNPKHINFLHLNENQDLSIHLYENFLIAISGSLQIYDIETGM